MVQTKHAWVGLVVCALLLVAGIPGKSRAIELQGRSYTCDELAQIKDSMDLAQEQLDLRRAALALERMAGGVDEQVDAEIEAARTLVKQHREALEGWDDLVGLLLPSGPSTLLSKSLQILDATVGEQGGLPAIAADSWRLHETTALRNGADDCRAAAESLFQLQVQAGRSLASHCQNYEPGKGASSTPSGDSPGMVVFHQIESGDYSHTAAYKQMCPNDPVPCEQQLRCMWDPWKSFCAFRACAVQVRKCDNQEPDDASIRVCHEEAIQALRQKYADTDPPEVPPNTVAEFVSRCTPGCECEGRRKGFDPADGCIAECEAHFLSDEFASGSGNDDWRELIEFICECREGHPSKKCPCLREVYQFE